MLSIDETIEKEKANAEKLRKIIETGYDGEISIESIFCDDTSAIKEAYERFENCAKEHEQRAEWLEELKAYRENSNGYNKEDIELNRNAMYNKAIDDFADKAQKECDIQNWSKNYGISFENLEKISEQLKAGVNNE